MVKLQNLQFRVWITKVTFGVPSEAGDYTNETVWEKIMNAADAYKRFAACIEEHPDGGFQCEDPLVYTWYENDNEYCMFIEPDEFTDKSRG